jgi:hypothetical protein
MKTWQWLYDPDTLFNWRFIRNVIIKTALLFVAFNLLFVLLHPLPALGQLSAYNVLFEGRQRLPYGENASESYNISLFQLEAMFASQRIDDADKAGDEYRVLLVGDSSVWGFLLELEDTLAAQINAANLQTANGKRVRAYNIGYPTMSLTKDLLLLDYAMRYDPDLVVWLFTLKSFDVQQQLASPIVQHNPDRMRDLIDRYALDSLDPDDERFVELDIQDKTIIGRRRALANMLRLQFYGVPWAITGIDQAYPDDYPLRPVDLEPDDTWHGYAPDLFGDDLQFADVLALDVLAAGIARTGDTPVLLVNEPMFFSDGKNSDIRYNSFYSQWAYDAYRALLHICSAANGWPYRDLATAVPQEGTIPTVECFTDTPVHLTPTCSAQLSARLGVAILQMADHGALARADDPS